MSLSTFFNDSWNAFIDWFSSAQAEVVQEAKTIIDELVPLVKSDIFADGSEFLASVGAALTAGTDPLDAIKDAAVAVWQHVVAQGQDISKAASTAAGAILVAKAKELGSHA